MSEEVSPSRALWLMAVLIVFVIAIFMLPLVIPGGETEVLAVTQTQTITPEEERGEVVEIVVVGGEVEVTKYGYAFEGEELTSPGPEIRVKVGSRVRLVFKNIGNLPHTFAITEEKRFDAEPLWGVQLGSPTNPIMAGGSDSVEFIPNRAGEYYYVCQVPGHIELGMWGRLIAE